MKENKNHHVIALRAASVLLVLVLLTTSIVSGHYARYTAMATGSASARVAKYQVVVNSAAGDTFELDPNTTNLATYTFSVTSGSEVAVEYDIIILPQTLPDGIALSLKRGETEISLQSSDNTYKAINAGTFAPSGGTHEYELSFTATKPVGAVTLEGISVRVDARQVD